MRATRVPSTTSTAANGDQQATWAGVGRCADDDCGDRLFLYRSDRGVVAWCGVRGRLIGACPGCGTELKEVPGDREERGV